VIRIESNYHIAKRARLYTTETLHDAEEDQDRLFVTCPAGQRNRVKGPNLRQKAFRQRSFEPLNLLLIALSLALVTVD